MRSTILLLLASTILSSCTDNGNRNSSESPLRSLPQEFLTWKKAFPDSIINHFPIEIDTRLLIYNSSLRNSPENIRYLTLVKKISSDDRQMLESKSYMPDSCLFEVYLRKIQYGFNYHLYSGCDSLLPIPEISLINEPYKDKDIKYYILEANNKGSYHSESYLRDYLPDEWQNGISKGIGVIENDSIIFYWTMMW